MNQNLTGLLSLIVLLAFVAYVLWLTVGRKRVDGSRIENIESRLDKLEKDKVEA